MKKLYSRIFTWFAAASILLVLLADAVFLFYFVTSSINNARSVLDTAVNNTGRVLEKLNDETAQINALVQRNVDIQDALRNIPGDANTTYSQKLGINGYLFTLQKNNTMYVDSFHILLDDGRQFKSTNFPSLYENSLEMPEYQGMRKADEIKWLPAYGKSLVVNNHKEGYVAVTYPLYNIRTGKSTGVVLEEICTETIENELLASCALENIRAEICDENGKLLLSVGEEKKEDRGVIESFASMENGWSLVIRCETWSLIGKTMRFAFLLGGALALIMILWSIYLSRKIADSVSKPIGELLDAMEKEDFNQNGEAIEIQTDIYEVNRLFLKYNQMISRLKELFVELEHRQQIVRKSEFAALQAQINPHFLYNTLDNITWKIRTGDAQDAIDEVMSLSRFFRLSLSKGADMVPIKNEMEHVQLYLKILKKRYVKKFDFEIESFMRVSDMERFFVPKLILQPLAENAVHHGFETFQEGGKIHISVDCKENQIIFEVYDNGAGIEKDMLELINGELQNTGDFELQNNQNGYGIFNINARIKNVFGEEYGLHYESEKGVFTIARLILPCSGEMYH
ncbi:MAG: sensor histidine kinase [Lachnospiraceae bacterium]|nr:sensor histidine kinase [Lachnospiraceae bacterium]